jgi:arylsulfatase A-like enzyme
VNLATPKSLVLITIDCLRADHTGFMGYARPTTPFLDALARESLLFPKAVVTGAPTYYSFPGMLASRFPLSLGREVVGVAPGEPTLATVLQEAGYRTAAFVAANPYLTARFGYEQGFEVFQDFLSEPTSLLQATENLNHGGHRGHGGLLSRINRQVAKTAHKARSMGKLYDEIYFQYCQRVAVANDEDLDSLRRFPAAGVLVDEACSWLTAGGGQPFFLWLHFMDPHAPYYPSREALHAMGDTEISAARARYVNESWKRADIGPQRRNKYRDEIVRLYDAGIRSADMQLERLVEFLRCGALWENCVFVVTADHGEEFLDHDGVFHPPSRAYQEMLHVPLLIRVPGAPRKLSAAPFSQLHLAATVLDAIGVDPPGEFEGRSYWPEMQAGGDWGVAISESVGICTNPMDPAKRMAARVLVLQDEGFKLVLDFERCTEELYDLKTDPQEHKCLPPGAEMKVRARMLRLAHEHLGRTRSNRATALRAVVREIGLEWCHSKQPTETLAS